MERYESVFGQRITIPRLKAVVVRWLGPCANGVAVPNPQGNPGLVADCTALLEARDILAGSATLNWSGDRAIDDWEGVGISGSPRRVTKLSLFKHPLTGIVPPQLGALQGLQVLSLNNNQLTGAIPPQLGALFNLQQLRLNDNQLTGAIPPELAAFTYDLHHLDLSNNALTGSIPPELGNIAKLRWLYLGSNQLTGAIPPQLDALQSLQVLSLNNNQLSGPIPPQLGALRVWNCWMSVTTIYPGISQPN